VSEIDIEFLTSDEDYYQRVHYTNQPGNIDGEADPEAYHVRMPLSTCNLKLTSR